MKKLLLVPLALLIYIVFAPSPAFAFDSFSFYCSPYIKAFQEGHHYLPTDSTATTSGQCWFNVPYSLASSSQVGVMIYKGVPGNAQAIGSQNSPQYYSSVDKAINILSPGFTVATADATLIHPKQDDDFFAVAYREGSWDVTAASSTVGAASDSYKIIRWKWGAKPASEWDPVIIIPGILSSWQNIFGQWTLDPITHIYDNLISTLEANGYVENKTLFKFPYDWEKSNVDTAKLLAQKIADIKSVCGCKQVDLVAHSMGGLVATQYIESTDYKDDVDQLIMLGTPLAGSPSAYRTWEAGQVDFNNPTANIILSRIFNREAADNGYPTVVQYLQNKPVSSVQELLPISNYLKQGSTLLQYPTGYPQNTFLQNLIGDPNTYYQKVFNKVQVTVVTGDVGPTSTVAGYIIKPSTQLPLWKDGEPVATSTATGDGTVPFDNAIYFSGPDLIMKGVQHSDLASLSEAYVFTKLTGAQPANLVSEVLPAWNKDWATLAARTFPSKSDFPFFLQMVRDAFNSEIGSHTLLLLMLFSPVDIKVTAPNGAQMGKDFSTGASLGQISNAIYSGPIGEHEYVVIEDPLPGQYKVETIGTGSGIYTVAAGRIDQATTTASLVSGTTTLSQIISNTLFVSSTSTAIALTPPLATTSSSIPPIATSTPTTTKMTPDTCVTDIAAAYKDKWIARKAIYDGLVFDCKVLKEELKARDTAKNKLMLGLVNAAVKLTIANMELLAKNRGNTEDAVLLITKYTTWFKSAQLQ